ASLGGPDERREQKFATLVGESFLNVTHKYFTHTSLKSGHGEQRDYNKLNYNRFEVSNHEKESI
ncbi:hypothetical protein, partial [Geobacillus subterraneus]|uniref:hypothetical protein n=1 Tax=Geobacillus subterraneus TaxID=129338 RepID=UPI000B20BE9D